MPVNDDKLERHHVGWLLRGEDHTWEIIKVGNKEVVLKRLAGDAIKVTKPREQVQAWVDTRLLILIPIDDGISKFADWLKHRREQRART